MRQLTGDYAMINNQNPDSHDKISFHSNKGNIVFNIIDGLDEKTPLDGIMIIFDKTNYQSFASSLSMVNNLCSKYPNIPVTLLGNKVDCRSGAIEYMQLSMGFSPLSHMYNNLRYYDISAKTSYQCDKPFLYE